MHQTTKIILTGGGTGGHFFPLVPLSKRLAKSGYRTIYIGDQKSSHFDESYINVSGKFRRNISIRNILLNIIDIFKIVYGFFTALLLLNKIKPAIVFSKGGYVALPVIMAAYFKKIDVIIHESDIAMGLSNKIAFGFAKKVCVAFPLGAYPKSISEKSFYTGLPLRPEFYVERESRKNSILIIGGSSGAVSLNSKFMEAAEVLLAEHHVIHQTGKEDFERVKTFRDSLPEKLKKNYQIEDFIENMADVISNAKLVISRAGASSIMELASQNANCIFVPIPIQVTAHQNINALYLKINNFAEIYNQDESVKLNKVIGHCLKNPNNRLNSLKFSHSTEVIFKLLDDQIKNSDFLKKNNYFLIGISGVSMKGLARCLQMLGKSVTGSDLKTGGHKAENITKETDLVIYSSAADSNSPASVEHEEARKNRIKIIKRSEAIGDFMRGSKPISVSGMHGKTTISSLIARSLELSGLEPSYLIGADSTEENNTSSVGKGSYFVSEACEYDGSFLDFPSHIAIISNIEEEHLDYFKGGMPEILKAFEDFILNIYPGGYLFFCADDENIHKLIKKNFDILCERNIVLKSYGFKPSADFFIKKYEAGSTEINFSILNKKIEYQFSAYQHGKHFALNAAACFAVCKTIGVSDFILPIVLENFKGAKRRFSLVGKYMKIDVLDDYAHHPTEIKATLSALDEYAENRRKIVIFQPHQQKRFNDFFDKFKFSFSSSKIDKLIVLPVYKVAGRDETEGKLSEDLVEYLNRSRTETAEFCETYDEAVKILLEIARKDDVIMTVGATDVWKIGQDFLRRKNG